MKRLSYALGALLLSVCVAGTAATLTTGSTRIAVLDLQSILSKSTEMTKLKTTLQKQFRPRRDALKKEETSLQQSIAKLQKNESVMTKTKLAKERSRLVSRRKSLQEKQTAYQKELIAAQQKGMQKILNNVKTAARRIAQRQRYDLVVLKNNALYATDAIDITTQVAKEVS